MVKRKTRTIVKVKMREGCEDFHVLQRSLIISPARFGSGEKKIKFQKHHLGSVVGEIGRCKQFR